jgi:hypothetical protein
LAAGYLAPCLSFRVGVFLLVAVGAGCGTQKTGVTDGGQGDIATVVPENTAARCQDGTDNDGDGKTDCLDPDCWVLSFCVDAGAKDAPQDAPGPDAPADTGPIDAIFDGPQTLDGEAGTDGPPPVSCNAHCDCPQGQFCYYGTCLTDPKMPAGCRHPLDG